MPYIVPTFKRR